MGLIFGKLIFAAIFGAAIGIASGIGLAWAFRRGHIPEYLKAPCGSGMGVIYLCHG